MDLGLDFGGLGQDLGSSRGVLDPTSDVLGPALAPKKAATPTNEKSSKNKDAKILKNQRVAARGRDCGARVKQPIPKKACLKYRKTLVKR